MTTPISDRAARFLSAVPVGGVLPNSDYGKGVCTKPVLNAIGDRIRSSDVLILVAPVQGRSWLDFGRVTLIKANWLEATEAVGHHAVNPLAWARRLADNHHYHMVVTFGRCGMTCAERDGRVHYMPAVHANVTDICGAGDTVIATLAVALARNNPLFEACRHAVTEAAQQISSIGVTRVSTRTTALSCNREPRKTPAST